MKRVRLMLLVAAIVGLDQWTKSLARTFLAFSPPRRMFGGLLTLLYAENSGAFLSVGSGLAPGVRTALFGVVVAIGLAVATWLLFSGKLHERSEAVAIAMMVGGGVGNVIDRFFRAGRVTDFLYLSAGPLHTGVFNVADMAITGSVIWLFAGTFRKSQDQANA